MFRFDCCRSNVRLKKSRRENLRVLGFDSGNDDGFVGLRMLLRSLNPPLKLLSELLL